VYDQVIVQKFVCLQILARHGPGFLSENYTIVNKTVNEFCLSDATALALRGIIERTLFTF
jgi:hypothetical protein